MTIIGIPIAPNNAKKGIIIIQHIISSHPISLNITKGATKAPTTAAIANMIILIISIKTKTIGNIITNNINNNVAKVEFKC